MIEEGQIVGDIIHETDLIHETYLFTTFAPLAGATEPRLIESSMLRPTALFLEGDTHSRRDDVFAYTGNQLAATVKGRVKRRWEGEKPGLSGAVFYDLDNAPKQERLCRPS